MQGWVDPGIRRSPCWRLHIAVAIAINTTVRGEIRTCVLSLNFARSSILRFTSWDGTSNHTQHAVHQRSILRGPHNAYRRSTRSTYVAYCNWEAFITLHYRTVKIDGHISGGRRAWKPDDWFMNKPDTHVAVISLRSHCRAIAWLHDARSLQHIGICLKTAQDRKRPQETAGDRRRDRTRA